MSEKHRNDPTKAMAEALAALSRAGVKFEKKTAFHIKVGPLNFWPSSGKIFRDGDLKKHQELGLPAFLRQLRKEGLAKNQPLEPVNDEADFRLELKTSEPGFETY